MIEAQLALLATALPVVENASEVMTRGGKSMGDPLYLNNAGQLKRRRMDPLATLHKMKWFIARR